MSFLGLLAIMRDALSMFNAAVTAVLTLRRFTNYLPRWALVLFTLVGGTALFEGWMAEEQGGHSHSEVAGAATQITQPESKRRQEILGRLDQEFIRTEGRCANLGDAWSANRWANKRLQQMGEIWQLPVGTVPEANISGNYVYGGCNTIDVQAGNASVNGNHLFSEDNSIKVGAGNASVAGNEMRALPMLPQEKK